MFEILEKSQYGEYEEFNAHHPNGSFLQSIHWSEVKQNWGQAVIVSRKANGKISGGMNIITQELKGYGKNYLYATRGPVMDYRDEETFADLVKGVRELSKRLNGFHFRMDPPVLANNKNFIEMAKRYGFEYDPTTVDGDTIQRRCSYQLDLTQFHGDIDELYQSFHPKWRYNIRLAARKGVECRVCGLDALDEWYKLYKTTGLRDNFVTRPESYIRQFLLAFGDNARLYMCYYDGKPLSGAICTNYAGKTSYVYGASSNEERNRMPNHLMQWNMMLWAMETDCTVYDFREIPMNLDEKGSQYGIYNFKKGFNGEVVTYASEFNLIFDRAVKEASEQARIRQQQEIQKMKAEEQAKALKKN